MGRGRAKAKQTKVARELKYSSAPTDFASLQRELSDSTPHSHRSGGVISDEHDADESSSRWNEDDDYDSWRR
ncbi:DUF3073 domain-containing protein [Nocardia neocaledoniensis]|uniref:DUF3073 family protein n=1 Tax=Nocardia neocaledoniensis TaxID=236511 RepID=A0A317NRN2_9NOCA|nr:MULTISPECIES: DUF3073 domain-containing protein [Nocardia]PWV77996.1 hypothetical protein DFR69_103602 [Nocardia neocaledoniensis]UGT53176.1 DUF3073 domain-containing protein [Nocardia asteroides]GEM29765.1 hypothetical protein NN3_07720 [Nocardia neocaledoniensis NBRC 108232]